MASREFADYLVELLAPLGPVTAKRMFGGFGLYLDGLMFAIIVDDSLYLKADAENRAAYAARDMAPFVYERQGKPVAMAYHALPGEALDDREDLLALARLAFAAALRGRRPPRPQAPKSAAPRKAGSGRRG